MTHDEVEIAIGMRQHGALDAAGWAALDDHLAHCASCRRFEHTTLNLETEMQARVADELSHINWSHVEDRLARIRAENRHLVPRAAAALVALALLLAWIYDAHTAVIAALFGAGLCAMFAAMVRRRGRELARAAGTNGELLAFYRAEVVRGLENTRTGRWFLPAMSTLWLGIGVGLAVTGHPLKQVIYQLAMGVFFAGWGVQAWRDHARLRREQAELLG